MKRFSQIQSISFLFASFILLSSLAYAGVNDEATFILDFKVAGSNNDTQTATVEDPSPEFVSVEVNGETSIQFTATVILQGATNLLGTNCDLVFDKTVLKVISITESKSDLNFDGRENVADILTLAERYGVDATSNELSYFDLDSSGQIDAGDIAAATQNINSNSIFWTSNPNGELSGIRESVEIFESPEVSNENGKIDDIVAVLLPRIHPTPEGFGFDGDARVADITFEIVPGSAGTTTLSFEDVMAIDEATEITQSEIINGSTPKTKNVEITLP